MDNFTSFWLTHRQVTFKAQKYKIQNICGGVKFVIPFTIFGKATPGAGGIPRQQVRYGSMQIQVICRGRLKGVKRGKKKENLSKLNEIFINEAHVIAIKLPWANG
jgi:hypothetical protein